MGFLKCLVCYQDVEEVKPKFLEEEESIHYIDSNPNEIHNKKSDKLLKEQVSVIYLVHNLLGVSLDDCAKYLEKYGNPSDWIKLCNSCDMTLKDALDIQNQILKLEKDLGDLKYKIIDQINIKVEEEEHFAGEGEGGDQDPNWLIGRNATYEIRQSICVSTAPQGLEFEDASEFSERDDESDGINNATWSECPLPLSENEWNEDPVPINDPLSPAASFHQEDHEWVPGLEVEAYSSGFESIARNVLKNQIPIKQSERIRKEKRKSLWAHETYKDIPKTDILPASKKYKEGKSGKTINSLLHPSVSSSLNVKKDAVGTGSASGKKSRQLPVAIAPMSPIRKRPRFRYRGDGKKRKNKQTGLLKKKETQEKERETKEKEKDSQAEFSKFRCEACNLYFISSKYLNIHQYEVHNLGIKCSSCETVLTSISNYENHTKSYHHPKSISTCSRCNKCIPQTEIFSAHLRGNRKCKEKAIQCKTEICKKFFPTQESLDLHKQIRHIDPIPPPYHCLPCNLHFTQKHSFRIHLAAHRSAVVKKIPETEKETQEKEKETHEKEKETHETEKETHEQRQEPQVEFSNFFCAACNLYFITSKCLNIHQYKVHNFGFKCSLCEMVVTSISSYENHTRSSHHPKSISTCSSCNKCMPSNKTFSLHVRRNPACKEKAIQCEICKTFFPTQESLDFHKQVRHIDPPPPPYHCLPCNLHFTHKLSLKRHLAQHHSAVRPFKCDRCEKSFARKQILQNHVEKVHLNKEPGAIKYPCTECDMVFTAKTNLKRHEKLHGEESPFLCSICGKTYKVGNQFTVHMWSHDPLRHSKYSLYMYKKKPKSTRKKQSPDKAEESAVVKDLEEESTPGIDKEEENANVMDGVEEKNDNNGTVHASGINMDSEDFQNCIVNELVTQNDLDQVMESLDSSNNNGI